MSDDKLSGAVRNVGGKVQDTVGDLTGDREAQAQGKLDQAVGTAQQMLGDAKQTASSAADRAKSTIGDVAGRVAATASDLEHDAYAKTAELARAVDSQVRANPLAMVLVAGALGLVVGLLLGRPPSERAIQVGRARLAYRDR